MLKYAFISVVAVMPPNWYGKSFSRSTDMTETSYIKRHVYDPTNTKSESNQGENITLDYEFRV